MTSAPVSIILTLPTHVPFLGVAHYVYLSYMYMMLTHTAYQQDPHQFIFGAVHSYTHYISQLCIISCFFGNSGLEVFWALAHKVSDYKLTEIMCLPHSENLSSIFIT